MAHRSAVLGVFSRPGQAAAAISILRAQDGAEVEVSMPAGFANVISALGRRRSRLHWATLIAAALGIAAGFSLCVLTGLSWNMVTGGKPVLAWPPFAIVASEIGALAATVTGLVAFLACLARLRRRQAAIPGLSRFLSDHIGVLVTGNRTSAIEILNEHGAEEVVNVP